MLKDYLFAAGLRLNAENLRTDGASFDVHLLLFAEVLDVVVDKVHAHISVGTTVRTALASPEGADYRRGEIYDYSVFWGASTSF